MAMCTLRIHPPNAVSQRYHLRPRAPVLLGADHAWGADGQDPWRRTWIETPGYGRFVVTKGHLLGQRLPKSEALYDQERDRSGSHRSWSGRRLSCSSSSFDPVPNGLEEQPGFLDIWEMTAIVEDHKFGIGDALIQDARL